MGLERRIEIAKMGAEAAKTTGPIVDYISTAAAAEFLGHTQKHVQLLCRQVRIDAIKRRRDWGYRRRSGTLSSAAKAFGFRRSGAYCACGLWRLN